MGWIGEHSGAPYLTAWILGLTQTYHLEAARQVETREQRLSCVHQIAAVVKGIANSLINQVQRMSKFP